MEKEDKEGRRKRKGRRRERRRRKGRRRIRRGGGRGYVENNHSHKCDVVADDCCNDSLPALDTKLRNRVSTQYLMHGIACDCMLHMSGDYHVCLCTYHVHSMCSSCD